MILPLLAVATVAVAPAPVSMPRTAEAFIKRQLGLARYRSVAVDLDNDRSPEVIVYANESRLCGSGGCTLYILTRSGRSYRTVSRLTVTHPPIRVLATSTHGWSDLAVWVAGGGVARGYEAQLKFNGRSYPTNPTMVPATSTKRAEGHTLLE